VAKKEQPDLKVHLEIQARQEALAKKDPRDHWEHLAQLEQLVFRETQAHRVIQEMLEILVRMAVQDQLVCRDLRAFRVLVDSKASRVQRVHRVQLEQVEIQGLLVQLDNPVQMELLE